MNVELGVEVGGVGAVGSGEVEVVAQVLRGALSANCDHEDGVEVALERLREVLGSLSSDIVVVKPASESRMERSAGADSREKQART